MTDESRGDTVLPNYGMQNGILVLPKRSGGGLKLTMELVNFIRDQDDIERYERVMRQLDEEKRAREDPDPLFWISEVGR